MDKHYGQIIEFILRKNDYNVSDLSKSLNINRRTLYNWFNKEKLKKEVIFKIGCIIRHDFSAQFPELFSKTDFNVINKAVVTNVDDDENLYWREKYYSLLKDYNKTIQRLSVVNCN